MCFDGKCHLTNDLATVPKCGNGGIDFNEQCDCGAPGPNRQVNDVCCECDTCRSDFGFADRQANDVYLVRISQLVSICLLFSYYKRVYSLVASGGARGRVVVHFSLGSSFLYFWE